ncbi:MAG: hypothetical protein ABEN55_09385 [Bradymonadaceae bacterium]
MRRTEDADLEAVSDPRDKNRITHPLGGVLQLGIVGLATGARSQRAVETRSTQLDGEVDEACGLDGRISDNQFGLILRRIEPYQLRKALHRTVRAEWIERENLRPTELSKSTVAIDGKNLTTLRARELRRLVSAHTDLDGDKLTVEQLRQVYATRFPAIQLRDDEEAGLIGVAMVHRATLVSASAAVVIDQRSIPGTTSEHGEITNTLEALDDTYGRTKMLERVTVDAGNMYRKTAQKASDLGVEYFGAIKESSQGKLYDRAAQWLGARGPDEADQAHIETYNGKTLVYRIWSTTIAEGTLGWDGARQLIRIQRVAIDNDTEEVSVGNRYFVSSEAPDELDALQAYRVARAHWRCENEGHWTADAIWEEDARRTPWTRHPTGIVNVGILRAIAINILALLRSMSRLRKGDQLVTPGWQQVIEHAFQALLTPVLETGEFDEFDN